MKFIYTIIFLLLFFPLSTLKCQEKTANETDLKADVFKISVEEKASGLINFNAEAIPASDFIIISYSFKSSKNFSCQIFDKDGKLVTQSEISYDENLVDFSDVKPETYYLKIKDDAEELKTFKVVKKF